MTKACQTPIRSWVTHLEETVDAGLGERKGGAVPSRTRTIMVRWWHESGGTTPEEEAAALRGTVLDLGGRSMGDFIGRQALFDLVERITRRPDTKR